jgi:hypothetical protein
MEKNYLTEQEEGKFIRQNQNIQSIKIYINDFRIGMVHGRYPSDESFSQLTEILKMTRAEKIMEKLVKFDKLFESWEKLFFVRNKRNKQKTSSLNIKEEHRKKININLNYLRQNFKIPEIETLFFINKQFKLEAPHEPKQREAKKDILTLEPHDQSTISIKLSKGTGFTQLSSGILCFPDIQTAIYCFQNAIENALYQDVIILHRKIDTTKLYIEIPAYNESVCFCLKLKFRHSNADGTLGTRESFITTEDSRLIHFLFGRAPPTCKSLIKRIKNEELDIFERARYETFLHIQKLVKQKINNLIDSRFRDDNFPWLHVQCIRQTPRCKHEIIIKRPSSFHHGVATRHFCHGCSFQLCLGCGKEYHGTSPCDVSLDEQSEFLINQDCKNCPQCDVKVYKYEGCNHMTCICRTEFCFLCGIEYGRDEVGRYKVSEHYQDNLVGNAMGARCMQFS